MNSPLWQCQHFGNIWSCKASLRGCPHDLRGWFTKWVSIFSHAGYISWCSKRVVYLALTVTLSAIFQTPPAAPHFFASVHICACAHRGIPRIRISFLLKMDVDACAGREWVSRCAADSLPFPSTEVAQPCPLQCNSMSRQQLHRINRIDIFSLLYKL